MTFQAKVIEDSLSSTGVRLITMQLRYPRFIHAEAKTHRVISGNSEEMVVLTQSAGFMDDPMLSRNASSSRAIPVAKMIAQVRDEPAMPVHWGANQPGMQARAELAPAAKGQAQLEWLRAARTAADFAESMQELGLHKQVANRVLEPFQWISVIASATEWGNFFELRDHPDADPNICLLAKLMQVAQDGSLPIPRLGSSDYVNAWHLPYITLAERVTHWEAPRLLAKVSAARCARVSYLTHDGLAPSMDADLALYERLVGGVPLHASPVEHQAFPLNDSSVWDKNFRGWQQHRSIVENEVAYA